jgi:hypothetical protein
MIDFTFFLFKILNDITSYSPLDIVKFNIDNGSSSFQVKWRGTYSHFLDLI